MDVCHQPISRDEGGEIQKGKGEVKDDPCEAESRMEIHSKSDEFLNFYLNSRSSIHTVIDIP